MKIDSVGMLSNITEVPKSRQGTNEDFAKLLKKFIADVNNDLHASSTAQEKLLKGNVDDMVSIMTTIEKADISLRLVTEIRNKAIDAYQEIMRMQV